MYKPTTWDFEYSINTRASRKTAWDFLSDMSNQVRMEPGIENIELDGAFATGTKGRTITKASTQEWELSEVVEEKRFTITGHTENGDMTLSFSWEFRDKGTGAHLTQHIRATGPQLANYMETFKGMEEHVPKRMAVLKEELDGPAGGS